MAEVIWSPLALDNLKEIAEYIGHTSEAQARVFLRQVVALAEAILRQPELGALVPEYEQYGLRERLLHSYRLIYRSRDGNVEIVTVVHGARRLPRRPPA